MSPEKQKFWKNISDKFNEEVPHLIKKRCIKCGECARNDICSINAVIFQPKKYPKFDLKKCNSCFRCLEVCTYNAIIPRKARFAKLFIKSKNIE